jgi:uncharacterized cupredoxin-like copper-binding protein
VIELSHRGAILAALLLVPALAACSSESGDTIAVTASDTSCKVAETELPAGTTRLKVTNEGSDVTEVYVYTLDDEVKGEVENIGPGTSRTLTADLTAGRYEVACKPGMKGDGIRTPIRVVGSGGAEVGPASTTVQVTAVDYEYEGLAGEKLSEGETVEFRLHNAAPVEEHELEIRTPDGKTLGEVGPTKPGGDGRVVLTLPVTGRYTFVCGVDDHEAKGMIGTFTVR